MHKYVTRALLIDCSIYFFPEALHKPISVIADATYNILVTLKICTPFSASDISMSNSHAESRGTSGGPPTQSRAARAEAERRREMALRTLDQQLQAATNKARQESADGST